MMRRMGTLGLLAATALATSTLAACMPVACTTIGFSSTLTVTLAEPRDDVALELCLTEGCTPVPLEELASGQAFAEGVFGEASGDGLTGWTIELGGGGEVVAYRLLAADATVLAADEVEPDWVRVGGSEPCGGPHEAELVLG